MTKRTKALTKAKRMVELEAQADALKIERDKARRLLRKQTTGEQHRIGMAMSRTTAEKFLP